MTAPAYPDDWRRELQTLCDSFPHVVSVYVRDTVSGQTFEHDSDRRLPSASLIKLFILWNLFERAEKGELSLFEGHAFNAKKAVEGGLLHRVSTGANLRLEDLALLMLAVSDNTATNLLIDRLGIDAVNASIRGLGFEQTVLGRKMLDAEARKQGRDNFTSAREAAELLSQVLQKGGRMLELLSVQKNADKLAAGIPYEDPDDLEGLLAHKTGELPGHEHDAGVFFHLGPRPVVAAVLTGELPHRSVGCAFCAQIGKIIYETFQP